MVRLCFRLLADRHDESISTTIDWHHFFELDPDKLSI
jgi:hypothetical protein